MNNDALLEPIVLLMAFLGLATHFLKAMMEIKLSKADITFSEYWKTKPYQSLLSVIGCIVGYISLDSMGQLTSLTAFGVGYMANSMADIIGSRTVKKVENN